jgi:predicted  nucleic acid-binding Zn-ribbon protein
MLRKEKDRLEKEIYILDKRKKDIQKKLDDVNKQMEKLQRLEAERKEKVTKEFRQPSGKEWKTMSLKY